MMKNEIVAIVPARGGSRGIPNKNIIMLDGLPLIVHTFKQAFMSKYIDRVYVSTDDKKIMEIAKQHNVSIINRPVELAGDTTPMYDVLKHALKFLSENEKYFPDVVVNLRPTGPLRDVEDIDAAIKKMFDTGCDSVVALTEATQHPYWMFSSDGDRLQPFMPDVDIKVYYQRQLLPDVYMLSPGVDVMRSKVLLNDKSMYGNDRRCIFMPRERTVDIDTPFDLMIAEQLLKKKRGNMLNEQ